MKITRLFTRLACAAPLLVALTATQTHGAIVLGFEGLGDQEQILEFYNGGFGGNGSGPGPNHGISFGAGALSLIDADNGGTGNFANEPSPDTIAFFLSTGSLVMNVPGGITTGFSFFYSSSTAGAVTVWDGPNATGNLLASIPLAAMTDLGTHGGDPTGFFDRWDPVGVAFAGTALSVDFAGTANQTGFDNITLGDSVPGPPTVPDAGATAGLLAAGFFGLCGLRRRMASKA